MERKYELTDETIMVYECVLHRIRALRDIGDDVEAGDLGGFVESERNLYHDGNAWVHGNAYVCNDARVFDDACVYGNAWVFGNACVSGDACVSDDAWVFGNAWIENDCHYLIIGPFGSRKDFATFFRLKDLKIGVTCGWFNGDIDAFFAEVAKTHGDNEHGKVYRLAAELAKLRINLSEEEYTNDDARRGAGDWEEDRKARKPSGADKGAAGAYPGHVPRRRCASQI